MLLLPGPQLAKLDWRMDYVVGSSSLRNPDVPVVQLRAAVKGADGRKTVHAFEVDDAKFSVLLSGTASVVTLARRADCSLPH